MKYLIFTDLDGTLLDHHTYSTKIAKKAWTLLNNRHIPIIFCSSKTVDEQLFLQKKLNIEHPFIVENGSAIIIPNNYFGCPLENSIRLTDTHDMIVLAQKNIADIHLVLEKINKEHDTTWYGFTSATIKEIAEVTELRGAAVPRAKHRWFTETLIAAQPNDGANVTLNNNGFSLSQGGRFLTIQDHTIDKGKAVNLVTQLFANLWKTRPTTIGIGESLNDAAMLQVVDKPFLVQKPDKTWANIDLNGLTKIDEIGPQGFLKMTNLLLAPGVISSYKSR
jgi:mannosyl-3-phosphoglycerate phosphatase family protein